MLTVMLFSGGGVGNGLWSRFVFTVVAGYVVWLLGLLLRRRGGIVRVRMKIRDMINVVRVWVLSQIHGSERTQVGIDV